MSIAIDAAPTRPISADEAVDQYARCTDRDDEVGRETVTAAPTKRGMLCRDLVTSDFDELTCVGDKLAGSEEQQTIRSGGKEVHE